MCLFTFPGQRKASLIVATLVWVCELTVSRSPASSIESGPTRHCGWPFCSCFSNGKLALFSPYLEAQGSRVVPDFPALRQLQVDGDVGRTQVQPSQQAGPRFPELLP